LDFELWVLDFTKSMKILFTGGGTGGHVFPIIAVAREMRKIYQEITPIYPEEELQFFYLGPKNDYYKNLLSQEGIRVSTISSGKMRRYFSFQNFIDIFFKIPLGLFQAFFHLLFLAPDLIFSKGGYGSFPVVFWAWVFQVPIFLHESDIVPGLANKIISRFSLEIFTSFPDTEYFPPSKMLRVGNPIRKEIIEGKKEEAGKIFGLKYQKPVLLILGGSQGAQKINDLILSILPELVSEYEIIHQSGTNNFKEVEAESAVMIAEEYKENYHLFSFLEEKDLKEAYQAADLIVSRAGSGSIFEIAANGKPSILIPLPGAAQNHQVKNAYAYGELGAAIVFEESNLTPHIFLEKIKYLFSHPGELENMKNRALEFACPKSAAIIAEYLLTFLEQ
jgi:UDP-N-acetylglucosamine--N-acetylmuramyl-(pentapeptide) pyrophosphoryl-undecaprenol N-acetylglucosamine transferase